MESFTHEEFITAMSMQGRSVKVTPKSLEEIREKEKRQLPSTSKSVVDNWKRSQEEEDMLRERRLREERKKKAQAMAAEFNRRHVSDAKIEESTLPPTPVRQDVVIQPCEVKFVPKIEADVVDKIEAGVVDVDVVTEANKETIQEEKVTSTQPQVNVGKTLGEDTSRGCDEPVASIARAQVSIASAPKAMHCNTSEISSISVELWWQGYIDLDLSCISFDKEFQRSDTYFFGEQSNSDAFRHSGDILCAPPPCGAREVITVNFQRINPSTQYVYFVMTAFSANDCTLVESLVIRIAEAKVGSERTMTGFDASTMRTKRAAVLCRICRGDNNTFSIECIDDLCFDHGETVLSLTKDIQNHLRLHP